MTKTLGKSEKDLLLELLHQMESKLKLGGDVVDVSILSQAYQRVKSVSECFREGQGDA